MGFKDAMGAISSLIIIGAASNACSAHVVGSRKHASAAAEACCLNSKRLRPNRHLTSSRRSPSLTTDELLTSRSLFLIRGGASSEPFDESHPQSRWWRSRKRWAKRKAAELAAKEAKESRTHAHTKHVILNLLRRLKRWIGVVVDFTTLKRLRLLRQARRGSWQHGGPIPVRYRGVLQELRNEVVAKPGLERRAKKVHHELDTVALGRFLEAAFWSLEHDGKRVSDFIEESIAWREKIGADRLRKEDVVDQGCRGAIIVKGHDLSRRPVVYFRPALDGRMEGDGNSKLMIYNLERAIRLMPRNSWQYTIVIDCEGMGLKQLPPVTYMKKMFKLLSHHYPMRLGHVLFTNVGPSVMLCWKVVSPLLQARTKAKMHLIPSTALGQTAKYIHPSQLLSFAGGKSPWQYDPAVYFSSDAASL
ncbi:unnamed protein product [Ectocarpus sp. 13 AM-2016]